MDAHAIRQAYVKHYETQGHQVIPRALLVPQNDPTTLFTGSGMQPLIPYLLGETHPKGTRLTNSQTCLRAQDIDDIGDNRHTTFFEMLGNWSLGDYFKEQQLPWIFEFMVDVVGLDPERIYVTCCSGFPQYNVPKDQTSGDIWKKLFGDRGIDNKEVDIGTEENGSNLGDQGGRIFYYGVKNWWSRNGAPDQVALGEPCGPDSEMFYLFPDIQHDPAYGDLCHPNCDCGRYIELGNSVFMEYIRTTNGFEKLPKQNVDYGGGLERIAAAALNSPDVYKISLMWPIIQKLQQLSGKSYEEHTESMRVIADHMRAATFLALDGVIPSNKAQGYVMRRLIRRAVRYAFDLGVEQGLCDQIIPEITSIYAPAYPAVNDKQADIVEILGREEKAFRQTLRKGLKEFEKLFSSGAGSSTAHGEAIFLLHDTYGFPSELTLDEIAKRELTLDDNWKQDFEAAMARQKALSQTAAKGTFKGGLAEHSEITTKYHTATHLMYKALRLVLGDHVVQRGSNITSERLRFDFSHPAKMTPDELADVERIVNEQIDADWPVSWREEVTGDVLGKVLGAFGDRYADTVKIYTIGDPDGEHYSREICGGPHVERTGMLREDGKRFKITKEEASSSGVRRIKAILQ